MDVPRLLPARQESRVYYVQPAKVLWLLLLLLSLLASSSCAISPRRRRHLLVIDDTAVTPRYVVGLAPQRELPIIGKIALGSLRNKLLFLLPAALLLSAFAPWAITPILMLGGAFLCFEASEKIVEMLAGGCL